VAGLALFAFGNPKVTLAGKGVDFDTRIAVALLAYLALEGRAFSREGISPFFLPNYDPRRAFHNLRRTLWTINKNIGSPAPV
jgi:DNA-binding SARP family transcriptional activator